MDLRGFPSLRALPRLFLDGAREDAPFDPPREALDRLRKVLRLESGDRFAALPGDGTLIVCRLDGRTALPESFHRPDTESRRPLTLVQALPKGEKLEEIARAATEIGVGGLVVFPSERSVARWTAEKASERIERLRTIVRESAELAFRTRLPRVEWRESLEAVLADDPRLSVLSEREDAPSSLKSDSPVTRLAVGPEGGWTPRELERFTDHYTLGPRVLRTEHAGPAAAAILLLG